MHLASYQINSILYPLQSTVIFSHCPCIQMDIVLVTTEENNQMEQLETLPSLHFIEITEVISSANEESLDYRFATVLSEKGDYLYE